MQVIHVHADGASSEYDAAFIKMVVGMVEASGTSRPFPLSA